MGVYLCKTKCTLCWTEVRATCRARDGVPPNQVTYIDISSGRAQAVLPCTLPVTLLKCHQPSGVPLGFMCLVRWSMACPAAVCETSKLASLLASLASVATAAAETPDLVLNMQTPANPVHASSNERFY